MNDDQELVSWMGVALLVMVIFTVYGSQIKAILFNTPATIVPTGQSVSPLVGGYEPPTATTQGVTYPTGVIQGSDTGLAA